jgi:predicted transcriptional regulator
MPTPEELHEADKRQQAAIEELRDAIERHEKHLERLDECMEEMRSTLATREDIRDLRADLRDRFDHYRERMATIEGAQDDRAAARGFRASMLINWLVVALFVMEIGVAVAQYEWMRSHG